MNAPQESVLQKLLTEEKVAYPERDVEALAKELQCDVEYADDYTLQVDLDSYQALDLFWRQLHLLQEKELLVPVEGGVTVRESRSGNHHATVKMVEPMPADKRILYHMLLGSDVKREALNYNRVVKNIPDAIVLFRPRKMKSSDDWDDLPF